MDRYRYTYIDIDIIYVYVYIYIYIYICNIYTYVFKYSFDNHIVYGIRRKTNQKLKPEHLHKTFRTSQFVTAHSCGCAKADV